MVFFRPLVSRMPSGNYAIRLSEDHRHLLSLMVPQIRSVIADRSQMGWRLFPNPYPDDPLQALQYDEMMSDELTEKRKKSLDTLLETIDATELTEEQLMIWMTSINDIRLVLGTRLDVTEDSEWEDFDNSDTDRMLFSSYQLFGFILESIVEAL